MFTGIVEEVGKVAEINEFQGGRELRISCSFAGETHIDESISVNGVCLTVVKQTKEDFSVQCVNETLRKTILGTLEEESPVNLERSLTLEKAIEGHIVQGHVDTVGVIESIEKKGADWLISISYDKEYLPYIVGRGSIAVDGISMTVARENANRFTMAVIPYTLEHTNLHNKKEGDGVNLEFDIFGKYIVRYMETVGKQ